MKIFFSIMLLALSIVGCKKEQLSESIQSPKLAKAEAIKFLQKELSISDFKRLDFSKIQYGTIGANGFVVVIKDQSEKNKFIIVANLNDKCSGSFININTDIIGKSGEYIIENLNKSSSRKISFENGKIISPIDLNSPQSLSAEKVKVFYDQEALPPVSVACVRYLTNDFFFMTSLYWILNQEYSYRDVYVDLNTGGGSQYYLDNQIAYEIEPDISETREIVDIYKIMNCFANISSNGATYSATLSADIPINGKPGSWQSGGNPGHAFITLTKTNGSNSVTQVFGFYPKYGPLSLTTVPTLSAIKNDGNHEVDASIIMPNISQSDFNIMAGRAMVLSSHEYDLNNYNCTDFALEVFNMARPGNEISVPNTPLFGGKMPGGLYNTLNAMKYNNCPEAANINMSKTNAASSNGECP